MTIDEQSPLVLPDFTEHNKDHNIWGWKSSYWLGIGTQLWQG